MASSTPLAHHGAGVALAALMAPGGLVVELFNCRVNCAYFDNLFRGCGLAFERLVNQHGHNYGTKCNGNNKKDASDNAPVDIPSLSTVLSDWVLNTRALTV